MHLSRVALNPARRDGRKLLGSPNAMHAAVLAAFPPSDQQRRTLWRVDTDGPRHWLYVLSPDEPDFAHIIEQAGWQTPGGQPMIRSYDGLLARLSQGQVWAFRVTANPSRTSGGKRYGHVTVTQQRDWLVSRASQWGFSIPDRNGVPDLVVHDRKLDQFQRRGTTVTLAKATYDGILTVSDADLLRDALVTGIGRAKAYGCGLLTLASVRG